MESNTYAFTLQEWETCLKVLGHLKDNPFDNPDNKQFGALITKIHKTAKKQQKQQGQAEKVMRREKDNAILKQSTIAKNALNNETLYSAAPHQTEASYVKIETPRKCYCCNQYYDEVHHFYHRLCVACAEKNYKNRFVSIDLSNRNIILTGGRVKVGYATALKLLRSQAHVTITTRFPALALAQFQQEKDYATWADRLAIYGLDLRNLKAVQDFINDYQAKYNSLDILINNAAQTIKYTNRYYAPLIQKEQTLLGSFQEQKQLTPNDTPVLSPVQALQQVAKDVSPPSINRFGQPVDYRNKTSWNSTLTEIDLPELLEVNLINHISPYLLIQGLSPLLKASKYEKRLIINVSSAEGQFSYSNKTIYHPHTNMTKAALNMLTRTSAKEYARYGIYMNSVDVGWVSTGATESLRKVQFEQAYIPPLDSVDAASRILHPIVSILQEETIFIGQLLKNYQVEAW